MTETGGVLLPEDSRYRLYQTEMTIFAANAPLWTFKIMESDSRSAVFVSIDEKLLANPTVLLI